MSFEDFIKAGKISRQALEYGRELVVKGAKPVEICDKIEEKIHALGGTIAFPTQISLNEIAAHFCPEGDEEIVLSDELCCLDVGAAFNGAVGDNALTVDLSGKHTSLVKASAEALQAATETLGVGVPLCKIGKAIEEVIKGYGFQPIRNLSGHGIGINIVHQKPTVPNFDNGDMTKLEKGMTIAIEPFATTGNGLVEEKGDASVFTLVGKKSVRVGFVREIMKMIEGYDGLPFTTRWLTKNFTYAQVRYALNQFDQLGILHKYPPLVEKSKGLVAQTENSFLIDDEVRVLTKL
jgi:methionyl aminopeptidase